jgi:hypothetical protein
VWLRELEEHVGWSQEEGQMTSTGILSRGEREEVMKGAAVPWQVIHVPRFLRLHSQL